MKKWLILNIQRHKRGLTNMKIMTKNKETTAKPGRNPCHTTKHEAISVGLYKVMGREGREVRKEEQRDVIDSKRY